ncbi:nucleotidyltransferase domain-containing protein [bacterium]|nr:nucleotidyltransferase domain-containing protein [bacterium]
MSPENVQQLLEEYREALSQALGDQLRAVYLYGSRARGEAAPDSDVDVLCVVRPPLDYGRLIAVTSPSTAALSLKFDAALSRVFVDEATFQTGATPFLRNVRREAIAL